MRPGDASPVRRVDVLLRSQAASENAADEAPVLARRDALALAAATLACAVSVSAPAADAAGIELGLRRIGRSAKFDSIDLSKYTTLPSGLKYYDVVVRARAALRMQRGSAREPCVLARALHSGAVACARRGLSACMRQAQGSQPGQARVSVRSDALMRSGYPARHSRRWAPARWLRTATARRCTTTASGARCAVRRLACGL
jgi:hypothetical protein